MPSNFPDNLDADPGDGLDRLIGLTDGIFAFSMTLLAVNVNLPQLATNANPADVTNAVWDLAPQLVVYATSFLLVAVYWQVNRRTYRLVKKLDGWAIWLALLQLMCVAFLPVATGLFDNFSHVPSVALVYSGTLTVIGILGQLAWWHARRAHLLDKSANPIQVEYFAFRGDVTTSIFLVQMVASIFEVDYSRLVLLLLLVVYPFLQQLFRAWYRIRHKER